jgi:hypothetical protein
MIETIGTNSLVKAMFKPFQKDTDWVVIKEIREN